jgi:hypothetical protein
MGVCNLSAAKKHKPEPETLLKAYSAIFVVKAEKLTGALRVTRAPGSGPACRYM